MQIVLEAYYLMDSGNTKIKQHVTLLCTQDQIEGQSGNLCHSVISTVISRMLWKHRGGAPNSAWVMWSGKFLEEHTFKLSLKR